MQCPKSQLPRPARASGARSGRFLSYSRERRMDATTEQPKTNHQRQPNACIFSRQQQRQRQRSKKQTTVRKRRKRRKQKQNNGCCSPRACALIGTWLENGWPVRGARPSVRAQSRARLPAYSPLTRLLHSCTTWQWLASELCVQSTPLQYRRDSRAEVTAHRAGPAASGDP